MAETCIPTVLSVQKFPKVYTFLHILRDQTVCICLICRHVAWFSSQRGIEKGVFVY